MNMNENRKFEYIKVLYTMSSVLSEISYGIIDLFIATMKKSQILYNS